MTRLLPCTLLLALAACASAPPEKDVPLAAKADDTVCEREARSGTNFPTTRCRTAEQRKNEQAAVGQLEDTRRTFQGMTTGK